LTVRRPILNGDPWATAGAGNLPAVTPATVASIPFKTDLRLIAMTFHSLGVGPSYLLGPAGLFFLDNTAVFGGMMGNSKKAW
jgi:hypothetical protein